MPRCKNVSEFLAVNEPRRNVARPTKITNARSTIPNQSGQAANFASVGIGVTVGGAAAESSGGEAGSAPGGLWNSQLHINLARDE